jgi:hypothetical protein
VRDEPSFVLEKVREALAEHVDEEVVAGLTVSAAGRGVRKAVPEVAGVGPRVGRYALLAMTATRLLLFDAKPAVGRMFVRPRLLVGEWPLDQSRVDARLTQQSTDVGGPHGGHVGSYAVRIRSGEVDVVVEAGYGHTAEAMLGHLTAATGGQVVEPDSK